MADERAAEVVVIGAGAAGMAAATALAEAGARVIVVESSRRLGGRASAFTDAATGERVDNGQHVIFGCYRETYRMLDRIGADTLAPLQARLSLVMVDARGRRFDLSCPNLPPPWHVLAGVLRWRALSWADRFKVLAVGRTIARARRVGAEAVAAGIDPGLTVDEWLRAAGQPERLCDWLWHPLTLAALNQPPDVAAAAPFVRVLGELFGPRVEDASVGLSTVPLDELYAEPGKRYVEARGGAVLAGQPATVALDPGGGVIGVETPRGVIRADVVVSAVPWFSFNSIWGGAVPAALETIATNAAAMASSPIVTINVWVDGPVLDVPFVGLVNSPVHWVFDKRRIVGGRADHLALVTSGADELAAAGNEAATEIAWEAVQRALPAARTRRVTRAVVVRERRATFSLAPGGPSRPGVKTPLERFFLAGDWTDTGLPATIEGAVLSGHRAAAAVLASRAATRADLPMP
jgi:squalene-associated FAD-dependent desaturase